MKNDNSFISEENFIEENVNFNRKGIIKELNVDIVDHKGEVNPVNMAQN